MTKILESLTRDEFLLDENSIRFITGVIVTIEDASDCVFKFFLRSPFLLDQKFIAMIDRNSSEVSLHVVSSLFSVACTFFLITRILFSLSDIRNDEDAFTLTSIVWFYDESVLIDRAEVITHELITMCDVDKGLWDRYSSLCQKFLC